MGRRRIIELYPVNRYFKNFYVQYFQSQNIRALHALYPSPSSGSLVDLWPNDLVVLYSLCLQTDVPNFNPLVYFCIKEIVLGSPCPTAAFCPTVAFGKATTLGG